MKHKLCSPHRRPWAGVCVCVVTSACFSQTLVCPAWGSGPLLAFTGDILSSCQSTNTAAPGGEQRAPHWASDPNTPHIRQITHSDESSKVIQYECIMMGLLCPRRHLINIIYASALISDCFTHVQPWPLFTPDDHLHTCSFCFQSLLK